MTEVANTDDQPQAKNVKLIYILYLVNFVIPITNIIGVIMAYVNKAEAPDWQKSHYQFLIRTFWIGLLYSLIGFILVFIFVGILVLLFVLVWIIVRCVKGMKLLDEGKPHPNPTGWMF